LTTGAVKDESDITERAARSSLAAHFDLGDAEPGRVTQLEVELLHRQRSGRDTVLSTLVDRHYNARQWHEPFSPAEKPD
jgi:hypothetical protein